jgi:hypothetical protein
MNYSVAWLFENIIVDVIVNIIMDEIYPFFIHDVIKKVFEIFWDIFIWKFLCMFPWSRFQIVYNKYSFLHYLQCSTSSWVQSCITALLHSFHIYVFVHCHNKVLLWHFSCSFYVLLFYYHVFMVQHGFNLTSCT